MKFRRGVVLVALGWAALSWNVTAQAAPLSDKDIVDAYHYFLGRLLVLRQEHLDLQGTGRWNVVVHRDAGGVASANPNLDVTYSEAWIAVDKGSCTIVELPVIRPRYYTVQVLNGWGETVVNINERNFPERPAGRFGLCLRGVELALPPDSLRIDLPGNKLRVLMRVELGANPAEAVKLQSQIKLYPTGKPRVEPAVEIQIFENDRLPRVEAFNRAEAILKSEPDINPGMGPLQAKVRAVAKAAGDVEELKRIDEVIVKQAIPRLQQAIARLGTTKNGWSRPATIGNYGPDFLTRTAVNLAGIWANNSREVVYFSSHADSKGVRLNGSNVYTLTFPRSLRPESLARHFWSVTAVDSVKYRVIDNPLKRYLLNDQSKLQPNKDGSVTLTFAAMLPAGAPEPNWLPTPAGQNFNLTFRFYGPSERVISGGYFPPPLIKEQ